MDLLIKIHSLIYLSMDSFKLLKTDYLTLLFAIFNL